MTAIFRAAAAFPQRDPAANSGRGELRPASGGARSIPVFVAATIVAVARLAAAGRAV